MSVAAILLGGALFLYVMEMWARKHPKASPHAAPAAVEDTAWVDRFAVIDTGLEVPAVRRYLDFVAQSGSNGGLIHNYVNRGFHLMTLGLRGVTDLNLRVSPLERMQVSLERYVDSLQSHPRWALDPTRVKPAMLMTVEIMESMNVRQDPKTLALIARAKEAALALPEGMSTLWQRPKVQDFFIRAGVALVALKDRASAGRGAPPSQGAPLGDTKSPPPAAPEEAVPPGPRLPVVPLPDADAPQPDTRPPLRPADTRPGPAAP